MDAHDLLSLRMSPDEKRRLTDAATLAGLSLDDFIVESAFAEANRVLGSLDAALARGIADAEASRARPADEVFSESKARYSGDAPEGTEEN
jgi:predicted transcriptional regulator